MRQKCVQQCQQKIPMGTGGLTDAAKLLVKLGAEKNLRNNYGRSPLDLAFAMADKYPLTAPELKEMGCREKYGTPYIGV